MWKNKYIDLVDSKPEYILPCGREDSAAPVREKLLATAKRYAGIYCELGSGSGAHLITLAAQNPSMLCVGFEIRFKRTFKTAEKAERQGLKNVLIVHSDARRLQDFFAVASLDAVFVNFPDPWDKARWQKHRLLKPEFLRAVITLLKTGGFLRYKTDHTQYFNETLTFAQALGNVELSHVSNDLYHSDLLDTNIPSEFEDLFRSKNLPVNLLELKKLG